ncbi:DUF6374 family protein [Nocardia miyunensis]|uniref:DUF6374 family protein n=1 Tax=Nocardia miyunensis TaxID=282684 RepID=UPI00350E3B19
MPLPRSLAKYENSHRLPPVRFAQLARQRIDEVRRQLLDAAAFNKHITLDQLDHMAHKLATGLHALAPPTGLGAGAHHASNATHTD